MEEVWKDIKGYEGYYQISNTRKIKSLKSGRVYVEINNIVRAQNNGTKASFNMNKLMYEYFDCAFNNDSNEIWKDIKNYEGKYKVSSLGRVYSIKTEKMLQYNINNKGYCTVHLSDLNNKRNRHLIHRLVAQTFIHNPNNYPIINHKDENPLNNNVNNLEWCDFLYNNNYGTKNERCSKSKINNKLVSKPVMGINIENGNVLIFPSGKEASRHGFDNGNVNKCCNGKQKHYKGYIWKFINSNEKEN